MRPRLAVLTTVYRPLSHADVIVSRWLKPLPTDAEYGWPAPGHSEPRAEIVSLYIDQFPENDMGRETAAQYNIPIFDSIRDALTLGGDTLAVDGVIIIAEHGVVAVNDLHQQMYPRREWFDEVVKVFRESGRSVPVFNDKHLSYDDDSAIHMVNTAREVGFPLMAGSSVSIAGCREPWPVPESATLREGVTTYCSETDKIGYHSIEFLQSLVARRAGGEAGIESVTGYTGESFLQAAAEGVWSNELVESGIGHAQVAPAQKYRDWLQTLDPSGQPYPLPMGFVFQHRDGLQTTYLHVHLPPAEVFAAVSDTEGRVYAGRSLLSGSYADLFHPHFAMLCARVEEFMLTGKSMFPIEHTLLCTLATSAACRALARPGEKIETPQLVLPYQL
jgi:hypothetical protein